MSEVSELLATVCEAQKLPLAQAWVRCQRCSSTDDGGEYYSLTTAGAPFHLAAGADSGFREACAEHHLRRGQGLVGEAAAARRPRFCADVTRRSKDAYPLAHYARMHGLAGCLAVPSLLRRRSSQSGASAMDENDDGQEEEGECDRVVLEFFLPPDCRSTAVQKAVVDAVFAMVREQCSGGLLRTIAMSDLQDLPSEVAADGDHIILADDDPGDCVREEDSDEEDEHLAADVADGDQAANIQVQDNRAEDRTSEPERKKKTGRKARKPVSLEELRGYFSGSLKDAARSLGVCPTTMKRICRQHGISRWPFRKISKVKHALSKINRAACSPKPIIASSSSSQPAPHLPCLSSALGVASSQGSSQEPPPRTKATFHKSLLQRSDGAAGRVVTIKASYKGDIIRFRVPCSAGVAAVKEEVAKRLALDAGALEVKYLDDDQEWVNLSCDADFQECLDVAPALPPSSAMACGTGAVAPVVRLMVQEAADNLGSSCGSSD